MAPSFFQKRIITLSSARRPSGRMKYIIALLLLFLITLASSLITVPYNVSAQQLTNDLTAHTRSVIPAIALESMEHEHSSTSHTDSGIDAGQILFYAVRIIYYSALMFAAGMMLWSIAIPAGADGTQRQFVDKWSLYAIRVFLLAVLVFIFVHVREAMKGYDGGSPNDWLQYLTSTSTGLSWLGLLILAWLGFVILRLNDSYKAVWALLLAAAESYNGHVMSLPANTTAIVMDFIHLVSSMLWAGGLMVLLLLWYKDRKEAGRFAEKFSKMAWLTIVLLMVSGLVMTFLILPSWRYLLYSNWGILLLVKVCLIILVTGVGAFLRKQVKKRNLPGGQLLKLDVLLMSVILVIVALFTYLSPMPETEPLRYHKMGETLHYTLAISPNGPGPNRITLKVWLPEQLGAPVDIKLKLRSLDQPKRATIDVPLLGDKVDGTESFADFIETDYYAERVDLTERGGWEAELFITDQTGVERKEIIPFRND